MLDGRDADDPAGEDEAVESEEDGEGDAQAAEGGARHGVVRSDFVYYRHKVRLGGGEGQGKEVVTCT
ncbi:hypothetical protein GCM10022403_007400 [Streptomyces coacervatus]|uniref:Uncharacterized protein n=1 Tax=Streptomyces coacervatus TaxID=647381 RepID=A0ABP7GVA7_9ACTN